MIQSLQQCVQALRLGAEAEASTHLLSFLDAIGQASSDPAIAEALDSSTISLKRVLAAQNRGDGIGVADALEYELLPVLQAINFPPR